MFDFLLIKKFNVFLVVSRLVLDFTSLHTFQKRVVISKSFTPIPIRDVSCLKV